MLHDNMMHPEQRIAVLVDIANLYHSAKNLYGARVNFKELLKLAVSGRRLVRAIAYVVTTSGEEEQSFFESLKSQGFELRMKDLQVYPDGTKKGDWDVGVSMDAVKLGQKVDVIVLVTGDGDYVPLVKYLQENSACLVEVVAFSKTASSKLVETADSFVDLAEDPRKYLIRKGPRW